MTTDLKPTFDPDQGDVARRAPQARPGEILARRVSFREAAAFWAKLGFISFGGPAGQIAIMHRELVDERRWISEERFLHALSYCMLLPGPEAQQLATYIGWLLHRTAGGVLAGSLFVLPSVVVLLGLSWIYAAWGNVAVVASILAGFQPVVVAIVGEAVQRIGKRALRSSLHVAIALLSFVGLEWLHVPFPAIVLGAALLGLIAFRLRPELFAPPADTRTTGGAGNLSSSTSAASALPLAIDDDAPPAPHTIPSRRRAFAILIAFALLWAIPYATIVARLGTASLQAQAYRFFTQAALVTFGGAYAVLAYVMQVAVSRLAWLTNGQAMVGLALAETTPGPLIMVLQFVGFMAGWNRPGPFSPLAGAVSTALVTTWATFLPCFLFILLGAPYIERLRGERRLGAALSFVTAAIVGVIASLGVLFGTHVLLPPELHGGIDWTSLVIAFAAFAALTRLHANVVLVIVAGGVIGLLRFVSGF